MADDATDKISEKAYELWVLEGRPEGRDILHWTMAVELVAQENTSHFTLVPEADEQAAVEDMVAALDNLRETPDLTHHTNDNADSLRKDAVPDDVKARNTKIASRKS